MTALTGDLMKTVAVILLMCVCLRATAQTGHTGRNSCLIEIVTTRADYRFTVDNMSARLNNALGRFEFSIPLSTVRSTQDSTALQFLNILTTPGDAININAVLPDSKDEALNLALFKGNNSVLLPGEIRMGRYTFDNGITFKGMLMGGDQKMAFDFRVFLTTPASFLPMYRNEAISEIKISALGDKIIGLTSN